MTKTEVHNDLFEELQELNRKPVMNPPDPEIYDKAIAKKISPERATLLAYAATNPTMEIVDSEQKRTKRRKLSDEQLRSGKVFLKRTFAGAAFGFLVGLAFAFVLLIVVRMNYNEVTNEEVRFFIILIAGTLIGAGLGYASAAKHLMSREKEHPTPSEHKTA